MEQLIIGTIQWISLVGLVLYSLRKSEDVRKELSHKMDNHLHDLWEEIKDLKQELTRHRIYGNGDK